MSKTRVSTRWLKDDVDSESFKQELLASQRVLRRLREMLQDDIDSSVKDMRNKKGYANTSWPYIQADCIAEQRAFQKVIDLLPIED